MTSRPTSWHVIVSVLLALAFMLAAAACSSPAAETTAESASAVVMRYLDALQRNDLDTANACLSGGAQNNYAMAKPCGTELDAIYARLMGKLSYRIDTPEMLITSGTAFRAAEPADDGTEKSVLVTITSTNVPVLFDSAITELSGEYAESIAHAAPIPKDQLESELYLRLARSLDDASAPSLTGTLRIRVVRTGGAWRIDADSELYNAVTGNFYQIVSRVPDWENTD